MSLAVDNPILNNPFEEPKEYWIYGSIQYLSTLRIIPIVGVVEKQL